MQGSILSIGSYGVGTGSLLSSFEDECVGSPPAFSEGIVSPVWRVKESI